jgi:hypothetical protein
LLRAIEITGMPVISIKSGREYCCNSSFFLKPSQAHRFSFPFPLMIDPIPKFASWYFLAIAAYYDTFLQETLGCFQFDRIPLLRLEY